MTEVSAAHRLPRMVGRDPDQSHRAATPLELVFDLTFVVAFSFAGNEVAHAFAEGHWSTGLAGFAFSLFAIIWAWINFTWFASAFDTDNWVFRLTTFVQMVGVIIAALGIPAVFASLEAHESLDNRVLVAGYVVMRLAMIFQWLRASRHPRWRRTARTYAVAIGIAQIGWVSLLIIPLAPATALIGTVVLIALELTGPILAERRTATPWHPHHVAERYSLLAIIALGEGVVAPRCRCRRRWSPWAGPGRRRSSSWPGSG